jgi:hypothetical protein
LTVMGFGARAPNEGRGAGGSFAAACDWR